jgi:hypothetical protein
VPASWLKCRRCRRVWRRRDVGPKGRCAYCAGNHKLHGIRRELATALEVAYLLGGYPAAQVLITPDRTAGDLPEDPPPLPSR